MTPLPIDPVLPGVVEALRTSGVLVLVAPPGAGKTTRVPRALLDGGFARAGEIWVLEPRRLAARLAAGRVAEELGEEVGRTVGYSMRFEDVSSPATRIRFVTEGTLARRLLSEPTLPGVAAVLLDEVHERNLDGDLALAMLQRLRKSARPELVVAAMSATVDAEPMAAFLGSEIVRAEGRRFDVAVEHLEATDDRPLEKQVVSAVRRALDAEADGDVLVFLPGALEIRRAQEALGELARSRDLFVAPLTGSLSPAEQDRAVRRADRRKVVLATNVAETSVTIDGVVAVVDSGLARVATVAPWSGLSSLKLAKVSRASATQRAGRAGRTRAGVCYRLYTRGDFHARPAHDAPEIARADLAEAALSLLSSDVDLASFEWFEAPPPAAMTAAITLLERLDAISRSEGRLEITARGRRMVRLPLHPRLSRLVVEAERRGVGKEGATIAALLGERDIGGHARGDARHGSDVLAMLDRFEDAEYARFDEGRLRAMGLEPARVDAARRVARDLARLVDRGAARPKTPEDFERALGLAVLAGYPDRVGRLRRPPEGSSAHRRDREILLATGGTTTLAPTSGVADVDLVVAVDVEERREGRHAGAVVRIASGTDEDALIELFADRLRDEDRAEWNPNAERVERVRILAYEGLVLEEKRSLDPDPAAAARVLAEAVRERGFRAFTNGDELDGFLARVAFARAHAPNAGLPAVDATSIEGALEALCRGATSFADLRARDLGARVRALVTSDARRTLDALAPVDVVLARGRRVKLVYSSDKPPSVASRLQDFFGMREGPRVANGRVPVVLELLAPNQRAVQVTTDLAGFWSKHYPSIAKELRRKYPRHAWPEDPFSPAPPPRPKAR